MIAEYERRQAVEAERQRQLRAQPPQRKETILEYWTSDAAAKAGIETNGVRP